MAKKTIEQLVEESGLTEKELRAILKTGKQKRPAQTYNIGRKNAKFGVISDTHIGNKCYDSNLLKHAIKMFDREKVDFVVHCGDICDGLYTHRPGHVFELEHIGADEQVGRAIEELSGINQHLFFITGNHTWNTFYKQSGHDIGNTLERELEGSTYLGNAEGWLELKDGLTVQLLHPDGGTAYAISYRPQKIVEGFDGGQKPNICLIGHYHKAGYFFYRNVHTFLAGCLESQTPFMKGKSIPAHKGFYIIDLKNDKKGVTSITPEFFPGY